jgi:hypothetical protein
MLVDTSPTKVISPANSFIAYSFEVYADEVVPIGLDLNNFGMSYSTGINDNRQTTSYDVNDTISGQWVKSSAVYQVDADQDYYCRNNIYFANGYSPDHDVTIKVRKIQHEIKDHTTPFVDGTRLDKTSDLTPYANHGAIYGATVGTNSTYFSGNEQYIYSSGFPAISNSNFSGFAWIKPDSRGSLSSEQNIFGYSCDNGWEFQNEGTDELAFKFTSGANSCSDPWSSNANIQLNEWAFVGFTFNKGVIRFYKDGVDVGGGTSDCTTTDINSSIYIGKRNSYSGTDLMFNGDISNVKIYNRTLSGYEVQTLFDKERGNFGI